VYNQLQHIERPHTSSISSMDSETIVKYIASKQILIKYKLYIQIQIKVYTRIEKKSTLMA